MPAKKRKERKNTILIIIFSIAIAVAALCASNECIDETDNSCQLITD